MKELLIIDAVVLIAIVLFLVICKSFFKPEYPYYKNPHFMTDSEKAFFHILKSAVGDKFYISCQTSLASLLRINKTGRERQIYFNKISRKSIDFVLLNKETLNPVLTIELDDSSHLWFSRQQRD